MNIQEHIEKILRQEFKPVYLEVKDETAFHAKHPEALSSGGGHFTVTIAAKTFQNKSSLERHRLIYQALTQEMGEAIHALTIKALTPQEFQKLLA